MSDPRDECIDCDGLGIYPSGAECKSCGGSGQVLPGDGGPRTVDIEDVDMERLDMPREPETAMKERDNGGPAFPFPYENNGHWLTASGMTLRDWFAGQVVTACWHGVGNEDRTAAAAYALADAMLAERAKP